jgi:hypothetical protein
MMRGSGFWGKLAALCVVFATMLGGCTTGTASQKYAIVTIQQGNAAHRFSAEVAATPDEQAQGLMYRTKLADDAAMLFPFEPPKIASFYMKNTQIPLDIFFIRADGTIDRIAENTVPLSEVPIVSGLEVAAVLEVNGGTAARLKIDENAKITWKYSAEPPAQK